MSVIQLHHGDVIKITGARYGRQRVGTCWEYTRENSRYKHYTGLTPDESVERAKENGHKLVWLNAEAVIIAADPSSVDRSFVAEIAPGDIVRIMSGHPDEAGLYRVEKPGRFEGDSCKLVRVENPRRDLTPAEIAVRERVWAEAQKPDQAHYADEDTISFTRTELRDLHESILQTGRELSYLRDTAGEEGA